MLCKATPTGGKCTPPKPKQTDPTNPSPSPSPNLEEPKLIYFRVVGENPCVLSVDSKTNRCPVSLEWKVENADKVELTTKQGMNLDTKTVSLIGNVSVSVSGEIVEMTLFATYQDVDYQLGTIEISGIRMMFGNSCLQGRKCLTPTDVCVKTNKGDSICVAKNTACYDKESNSYYQTSYIKKLNPIQCFRDEAGFTTGQVADQLICQGGNWINHYLAYGTFSDLCPDESSCRKYKLPNELQAFLSTNCCEKMENTSHWDQYKQYCEDKNQPQEPTNTIEKTTFLDWLKNLLSI